MVIIQGEQEVPNLPKTLMSFFPIPCRTALARMIKIIASPLQSLLEVSLCKGKNADYVGIVSHIHQPNHIRARTHEKAWEIIESLNAPKFLLKRQ